jgi:hypothetical protein
VKVWEKYLRAVVELGKLMEFVVYVSKYASETHRAEI